MQQRTFDALIGHDRPPPVDPDLPDRLRARLEETLDDLDPPEPIWLFKGALAAHARCPGFLHARLLREDAFRHSARSAAGTLMHRAIQLDVASERSQDVRTLVERAAGRLLDDAGFAEYWEGLDTVDRAEVLAEGGRALALFRDMFPPVERRWQPLCEQGLRVRLCEGRLVLSGRVDLMLGRGRRLLIDFKDGEAKPEHAEDARFYALLATLFFGVAPYRVATMYVRALDSQPEDVTERTLVHAADRVAGAARAAAELLGGQDPRLTPGPHCAWCPRARTCPQSTARPVAS